MAIVLTVNDCTLNFQPVQLHFGNGLITNIFAKKNNKTLQETLLHRKYSHLSGAVIERYPRCLQRRLGEFLLELKLAGDLYYKQFLNSYGDEAFCEFRIRDRQLLRLTGLYCFVVGQNIKYIGKSTDTFNKRINQGYGRIHPKNCYRDGQATNCHLNELIARQDVAVQFFACPLSDTAEIKLLEHVLITREQPEWNIQLKRSV